MPQTSPTAWKRLVPEGIVIVASILLAFAIDAWWDEHKKDEDVRDILSLVELETISNLANLKISIARHEEIVKAISTATQNALNNRTTVGSFATAVIDVEVFEPNSDALKTLVSTGMLGAIDDIDLRIALGAFDGLTKNLKEKESAAAQLRDAARRRIASIGERIYGDIPDSSPISADTEALNLLEMRATEEINAIEAGRKLEAHLQSIADQMDAINTL